MKELARRLLCLLVSLSMVLTLAPVQGLAEALGDGAEYEEALVEDLSFDEDAEDVVTEDGLEDESKPEPASEEDAVDDQAPEDIVEDETEAVVEDDDAAEDEPEVAVEEEEGLEPQDDGSILDPTNAKKAPSGEFTDVPAGHWAHYVVWRAAKLELMSGYSGDRAGMFGPEDSITRAQVVTVLWRMAGKPDAGTAPFSDVATDACYAKAVAWAASKGVVPDILGNVQAASA